MILDDKLSFNDHISLKLSKARKGIGILKKLFFLVPRDTLLTIYKSFIRPHLDYCDFIYNKPYNESFTETIESIQYNAALAITGAIKGTSKDKIYQELGLEKLSDRRWLSRLSLFFKIINTKSPPYLFSLIPMRTNPIPTRSLHNVPLIHSRTEALKNYFFPNVVIEWNKLDTTLRNSLSLAIFKKSISKSIRPRPNSIYGIFNPQGLKYLSRLRLNLSHLREHKFKHNFQDTINPICNCSLSVESTEHFFLHCLNFNQERLVLLNNLATIDNSIRSYQNQDLIDLLLYGNPRFDEKSNHLILTYSIDYIRSTKRFDDVLF